MRRSSLRVRGLPCNPLTIDGHRNIGSRPSFGAVTAEFRCDHKREDTSRALRLRNSSGSLAIFAAILRALSLIFGLARAPSKECGRCLLTKFALAQFAARLGFWRLGYERHLALNIFDAVSPHPVTGRYTRPIHTAH